jgi:hypothetical protein
MIRKTIAFVWEDGMSRKGKMPTAHEMEVLVEERRDRIRILLQTTPVAALGTTDFWDMVLLDMVDHYFLEGVATPYEMSDREMVRRKVEHVIRNRFGANPTDLMQSIDRDARAIVRYIEAAWADELWAA